MRVKIVIHFWHAFVLGDNFSSFSICCFLDQFRGRDASSATFQATGHQLVTLCRAVCAEERQQILDPLLSSWCHYFVFVRFFFFLIIKHLCLCLQR